MLALVDVLYVDGELESWSLHVLLQDSSNTIGLTTDNDSIGASLCTCMHPPFHVTVSKSCCKD
jgi:hypothetical protein